MRIPVGFFVSLVAAAACGGGSSPTASGGNPPPPPAGSSTHTVNMTDYAYSQAALTIKAGDAVKWVNAGNTSHTVTSDGGVSPAFDSGTMGAPGTTTDPYGG